MKIGQALMEIINYETINVGLLIVEISNTWLTHHDELVGFFVLLMSCKG